MKDLIELNNKFKTIKNPRDYFEGKGNLVFPIPNNILCFFRDSYNEDGLWPYVESHYRYVCIFNLKDPLEMIIDGSYQKINKNEGLIILPFQYHKFILPKNKINISSIFITFTMLENTYFEQFRCYNFQFDEQIVKALNIFYDNYNENGYEQLPYVLGKLLLHISNKSSLINKEIARKTMKDDLLLKIISSINNNLNINILELSIKLGYSENYLRRYFKKNMGLTLGRYIIEIRIAKAISLLNNENQSITEVADKCGYDSISSFSRVFKQLIKCSPKTYINIIKEHPEKYNEFRYHLGLKINTFKV